jgi:hypothetical protein
VADGSFFKMLFYPHPREERHTTTPFAFFMHVRDRIRELRRVPAQDLRPNPRNWRVHPDSQRGVLKGLLAEVGYADALLARELADGTLELIDGHLRAETTPDSIVPVLVLDVDEAEANKLIAALDPLARMAETDTAKLESLLNEIDTGSEALQEMLSQLAQEEGIIPPDFDPTDADSQGQLDQKKPVCCPKCGHEFTT